jgi:hypothetical protein
MALYRVIEYTRASNAEQGSMKWTTFQDILAAYSACIPTDKMNSCRLLLNGLLDRHAKGETLVRISCDGLSSSWIQTIRGIMEPVPVLDGLKIECCHGH